MEYSGTEELIALEEGAPNYNQFLVKKFKTIFEQFGISKNDSVLDYGAGIGTLCEIFTSKYNYEITCLEIDKQQKKFLEERGFRAVNRIEDLPDKYSGIYMSNVLEHIQDDEKELEVITRSVLAPGGILIIYVPALPSLYSPLDKKLGHYRRYTKKRLENLVMKQELIILKSEYVDSLGVLGWIIQKGMSSCTGNVKPNRFLVSIYDTLIFPISRFLDQIFMNKITGKNILFVLTKRLASSSELALKEKKLNRYHEGDCVQ